VTYEPTAKDDRMDSTSLWLGLVFSTIGLGFFMYGRKQKVAAPLICGLVLMVYPYFISSIAVLVVIGAILIAIPYFFRR
jgi:hypothetical protein